MADDAEGNGEIGTFRALIEAAGRIVVLTGAGISTESGIPDFRSPGGLWASGIRPITYQDFVASEEARMEEWRRRFRMNATFGSAEPNAGHRGLVRLRNEGKLLGVVTQNIDGLHQRAGLATEIVIEIHGNATRAHCLDCRTAMSLDEVRAMIDATGRSPRCACGGFVKAAIVSFGERMPEAAMARATTLAEAADLFLVIGSSLVVHPAATLPLVAKRAGATLAILNRDPTALDEHADFVLQAPIGEVFSALYPQAASSDVRQ